MSEPTDRSLSLNGANDPDRRDGSGDRKEGHAERGDLCGDRPVAAHDHEKRHGECRPDGSTDSAEFFVRGYDEPRLRALLVKAGFEPLKRWRALNGRSRGPRLVLLARKVKRGA